MAAAIRDHYDLECLTLMVSRRPLAKENAHPRFDDQIAVLTEAVADVDGLEAAITDLQLLSDIGAEFDLMVLGADKWHQIQQAKWYPSVAARDQAMDRLPRLAVFARAGFADPPAAVAVHADLVPPGIADVSSTRARAGEIELMAPAARRFARATGAWIDPERYERWLAAADGGRQ